MIRPKPKSILCLDIGSRRIGLAGCDPLGITISRIPALHRTSFNEDLEKLKRYCEKRNVQGLVIGIPLDEHGFPTKQTRYCTKHGQKIAQALELPIAWVNEHSSSWAAGEKYKLKKDRSGQLDSAAAELLLDQWLKEGPELKPVHVPAYPTRQVN